MGFNSLVNEVWKGNLPSFNKKADEPMEKNPELSKKEIREDVSKIM